jgi:hypothetical protein
MGISQTPQALVPASIGRTILASGTLSTATVNLTSIDQSFSDLYLVVTGAHFNSDSQVGFRFNSNTGNVYNQIYTFVNSATPVVSGNQTHMTTYNSGDGTGANTSQHILYIYNYSSTCAKIISGAKAMTLDAGAGCGSMIGGFESDTAITSISIKSINGTSTFSGGTYTLYGVK